MMLAPCTARRSRGRPLPRTPSTAKADGDGDRVSDDLERQLAPRGPDESVEVIVTLARPASAERVRRLEQRVGALAVHDRYRVVDAFAARASKETGR
jgi:hypothetical protein